MSDGSSRKKSKVCDDNGGRENGELARLREEMRVNPNFWVALIERDDESSLLQVFVESARQSPAIRRHRRLIETAYDNARNGDGQLTEQHGENCEEILQLYEPSSRAERESFLIDAIGIHCKALTIIPHEVQLRFAGEICKKLVAGDFMESEDGHWLAPDLWEQRAFLLSWFEHMGHLPNGRHLPDDCSGDPEFWWHLSENGCLYAPNIFQRHCPNALLCDDHFMRKAIMIQRLNNLTLFPIASEKLRNDKTLVLHVLDKQENCYLYFEEIPRGQRVLPQTLLDDHDVKVCVLTNTATDCNLQTMMVTLVRLGREVGEIEKELADMKVACLARAQERVQAHKTFWAVLLPAMSSSSLARRGNTSTLKMLVVDPDTTLAIKKQLADYLDVPSTRKDRMWLSLLNRNNGDTNA